MAVMSIFTTPLSTLSVIDFGIQWSMFVVAVLLKTEKFYDLTGSITFLTLIYLSYEWSQKSFRQTIQAGMVTVWAIRLGLYLYLRIMKTGGDWRFNEALKKPRLFFIYWTFQGVWVIVTLLPTLKMMTLNRDLPFSNRDYIGYSLWIVGFLIEVIADYQKSVFRNNPKNKGHFISTGLWSFSRHPNYFGEIMLWFGLYLSASSVLRGWEQLTILCPIFDMLLITKFSGIPPLEKHGLLKWGGDPQYLSYLRRTPVLIPFIW